jgi:tRNA-2-methylthio-N6-dimethylallyladenosine synthase
MLERALGHGKKYYLRTYGCQMNERDSEVLEGYLEQMGYCPTESENEADVIILNTCCVREKAELKVFGKLGELKKLKDKNPDLIIGICGCMTQQDEVVEKLQKNAPYVDMIFGTHNVHQLPEILAEAIESKEAVVQVWEKEGKIVEGLPSRRKDNLKAYVNISYGCNNFCTYCIVPYTRGRERSRKPDDILSEICKLADHGYLEVMLLGQNVNSYGKDFDKKFTFADLLKEVNKIPGIQRIRYMTSHPRDFNKELIHTIADCEKVCEHYHLPLQAGSNRILKRMNRGYTREHYLELVNEIKRIQPKAAITTDLIVGFPGETEKDFEDTLDMVKKVRFDSAYTFIYSPRKGTPAAKMEEQIEYEEKRKRLLRLNEVQNKIGLEINEELVGSKLEVLVEGFSKTDKNKLSGRTRTNKIVIFEGNEDLVGKFIDVKIEKAQTWNLIGSFYEQ